MSDLERRVLETIDRRGITPRPYAYFFAKRFGFWTLAILLILLGAMAVAVVHCAVSEFIRPNGDALHTRLFENTPGTLILVRTSISALFCTSAVICLRHTPRNYRYGKSQVIGFAVG